MAEVLVPAVEEELEISLEDAVAEREPLNDTEYADGSLPLSYALPSDAEVTNEQIGRLVERHDGTRDILYKGESMRACRGMDPERFDRMMQQLIDDGSARMEGPRDAEGNETFSLMFYDTGSGAVTTSFLALRRAEAPRAADEEVGVESSETGQQTRMGCDEVPQEFSADAAHAAETAMTETRWWVVDLREWDTRTDGSLEVVPNERRTEKPTTAPALPEDLHEHPQYHAWYTAPQVNPTGTELRSPALRPRDVLRNTAETTSEVEPSRSEVILPSENSMGDNRLTAELEFPIVSAHRLGGLKNVIASEAPHTRGEAKQSPAEQLNVYGDCFVAPLRGTPRKDDLRTPTHEHLLPTFVEPQRIEHYEAALQQALDEPSAGVTDTTSEVEGSTSDEGSTSEVVLMEPGNGSSEYTDSTPELPHQETPVAPIEHATEPAMTAETREPTEETQVRAEPVAKEDEIQEEPVETAQTALEEHGPARNTPANISEGEETLNDSEEDRIRLETLIADTKLELPADRGRREAAEQSVEEPGAAEHSSQRTRRREPFPNSKASRPSQLAASLTSTPTIRADASAATQTANG